MVGINIIFNSNIENQHVNRCTPIQTNLQSWTQLNFGTLLQAQVIRLASIQIMHYGL